MFMTWFMFSWISSLFAKEPESQYLECELSCGQRFCFVDSKKKTNLKTDFWNQNIPLRDIKLGANGPPTLPSFDVGAQKRSELKFKICDSKLWLYKSGGVFGVITITLIVQRYEKRNDATESCLEGKKYVWFCRCFNWKSLCWPLSTLVIIAPLVSLYWIKLCELCFCISRFFQILVYGLVLFCRRLRIIYLPHCLHHHWRACLCGQME